MYLAPGVEMVMFMMSLDVVMSYFGVLTSPAKTIKLPPQLILFYVVPLSVVYSPLGCDRMIRLWVCLWAPDPVQSIK